MKQFFRRVLGYLRRIFPSLYGAKNQPPTESQEYKPKSDSLNRGEEAEDLVEDICHTMFLKDFTVRNPKFKKSDGNEREAADFLVPFGNTILAFQVKSKTETKSAIEKSEEDFARIEKRVNKGVRQLYTLKSAIDNSYLSTLVNSRGVEIPFFADKDTKIVGVVILELFGEDEFGEDERTAIYNGFTSYKGIPANVFTRQVFETIATELDTIPDFLKYLEIRQALYERGMLIPTTHELDLLALYKTRPEVIEESLDEEIDLLAIDHDSWATYRSEHRDLIRKRDDRNRPSYFIDAVIEWLHSAIESGLESKYMPNIEQSSKDEAEKYVKVTYELASIPRLHRRMIGEKAVEKLLKADREGDGHSLVMLNEGSAILVIATNWNRQQRANGLLNLASIAYCGCDLRKVIGIATEPLSAKLRSYDVIVLEDLEFENADELAAKMSQAFGQPRGRHINEYDG